MRTGVCAALPAPGKRGGARAQNILWLCLTPPQSVCPPFRSLGVAQVSPQARNHARHPRPAAPRLLCSSSSRSRSRERAKKKSSKRDKDKDRDDSIERLMRQRDRDRDRGDIREPVRRHHIGHRGSRDYRRDYDGGGGSRRHRSRSRERRRDERDRGHRRRRDRSREDRCFCAPRSRPVLTQHSCLPG